MDNLSVSHLVDSLGRAIPLATPFTLLGRGAECHVVIADRARHGGTPRSLVGATLPRLLPRRLLMPPRVAASSSATWAAPTAPPSTASG